MESLKAATALRLKKRGEKALEKAEEMSKMGMQTKAKEAAQRIAVVRWSPVMTSPVHGLVSTLRVLWDNSGTLTLGCHGP